VTGTQRPSGTRPLADLITESPSPNYGPRRDGITPSIIVLHYTAMDTAVAARDRLCDPEAEVSAHYLISKAGEVVRLVPEKHRAWHAGQGEWRGRGDINSRSIGIELDNSGTAPFSAPLMDALEELLQDVLVRWHIELRDVIGHSDMAPGRKVDPGPRFDWARLQRRGLAARPDCDPAAALFQNGFDGAECADLLSQAGYTSPGPLSAKLQAFRERFLPMSKGAPNGADRAMLLAYFNEFGGP